MKLILLIILIIFGFQSSAWGQAPTLSIEAKQEPIQEIMKKIEHQTGMTFSYDPSILKGISRITFKSDNQSISEPYPAIPKAPSVLSDKRYPHHLEETPPLSNHQRIRTG